MGPGPVPWPFGGAGAPPRRPRRDPPHPGVRAEGRRLRPSASAWRRWQKKRRPGGPAAGGPAAGGPVARRPGSPAAGRTRLSDTPVRHTHPTYIYIGVSRESPRAPLMEAEGYSRRGFFFPKNERLFFLKWCFMCFRQKVRFGAGFFTNLPSFPPLQSNPLHFLFQGPQLARARGPAPGPSTMLLVG